MRGAVLFCFVVLSTSPVWAATPGSRVAPGPAKAHAVEEEDEDDGKKKVALPPDPSGKLYEKFEPWRGFYLASDVGLMWMFGGVERAYSSTQLYIGIDAGYDFNRWLGWQIHAGRGFAASAPRTPNQLDRIRDFGFTNLFTGPVIWLMPWERLAFELRLFGGLSLLDPAPLEPGIDGPNDVAFPQLAPAAGGGLGLKYLTLLTDFTIGLEVSFTYIIYPTPLPVLNVSPLAVRYTF